MLPLKKTNGICTQPMSEKRVALPYNRTLSLADFDKIKKGYVPQEIEDKWYAEFAEGKLNIYKARSGACIYIVGFGEPIDGRVQTRETWVASDPKEFTGGEDADYEMLMINIVIDDFILRSFDE